LAPSAHRAIVSPDIWEQVQAALARAVRRAHPSPVATRRPRSGYPLVGLVKCGTCGANFTVDRRHNGAGRLYADYVCGCRKNRGKAVCANSIRISRATVDARVFTLVKQRLIDPTIRERLRTQAEALRARAAAEARRSRPALEPDLAKLIRKIDSLVERLALLPPDPARVVGEKLEEFGHEREEIRRKLVEADQMGRVANAGGGCQRSSLRSVRSGSASSSQPVTRLDAAALSAKRWSGCWPTCRPPSPRQSATA